MRRSSRARWNREDLLGRRGYGHVRWRGEYLGSGRPVPGALQAGQIAPAVFHVKKTGLAGKADLLPLKCVMIPCFSLETECLLPSRLQATALQHVKVLRERRQSALEWTREF